MNPVPAATNAALLVALAHGTWWSLASLAALRRPSKDTSESAPRLRMVTIVPAHNEESMLGACLQSLRDSSAGHHREVVVVADNCTDQTAAVAQLFGATTLERHDVQRIGKSYALDFAIEYLRSQEVHPDAVLFVDADSTVSPEFFQALERRFSQGAGAVQLHYRAAPGTSSLGKLRGIALELIHWSRPLGASRLGLGTTLKGNGMGLRWDLVRDGFGGEGLAEDAATTLSLARRGVAIAFEPSASVTGFMAQDYNSARTQDERWERGRLSLVGKALTAAATAFAHGNVAAAAGALEVASLPLSLVTGIVVAGGIVSTLGYASTGLAIGSAAALGLYVIAGLASARVPFSELTALTAVPRYVVHKAGVYIRVVMRPARGWRRTERPTP